MKLKNYYEKMRSTAKYLELKKEMAFLRQLALFSLVTNKQTNITLKEFGGPSSKQPVVVLSYVKDKHRPKIIWGTRKNPACSHVVNILSVSFLAIFVFNI